MNYAARHTRAGYREDEQAWLLDQAGVLRDGRLDEVDRQHLSEYLSDMAARDRREVRQRLILLIGHIIKCRLFPDRITRSWVLTVREQQRELKAIFEDSPSLRAYASDVLSNASFDAYHEAALETGYVTRADEPLLGQLGDLSSILVESVQPVRHPAAPLLQGTVKRRRLR